MEESTGYYWYDYNYRLDYYIWYNDGEYTKENNPDFTDYRTVYADWLKRVADNNGDSWGQTNYNHM